MKLDWKKLLVTYFPYLVFAWLFNKAGQCYRLAAGADMVKKAMGMLTGLGTAIKQNPLPSLFPRDLLVGVIGAAAIRIAVYFKIKNAKKYRPGREYGSARWGTAEDIKPFIDPKFDQNILLTQTERIMVGRNKNPKYNINKNVLIIGGSGSGKTRFHIKPNLMQMNASYIVTDPKGYNVPRQTQINDAACRENLPKGASTPWRQQQKLQHCMSGFPATMNFKARATVS